MRTAPLDATEGKLSPAKIDKRPPLRLRAIIAILVAVPLMSLFGVWGSWVEGGTGPAQSLNSVAVAVLFGLTAINLLLRRRRPNWAFSPGELLALYLVIVTCMSITGGIWLWGGSLPATIAYPTWAATPDNRWEEILLPMLPHGLIVTDRNALEGFVAGGSSAYRLEVLRAWFAPALYWTVWITVTLWITLCLNVIVRRRWSGEEKLAFPMTILPMHLTDPTGRLFRDRLFWIGAGISVVIGTFNTLHNFLPAVPAITTAVEIESILTNNPPWDAIRGVALYWGPWPIGLSYLMPLDFAFSLIVFNLFWKAEYMFSRMMGWLISPWSGFPYGDQQNIGAYLALMGAVLWLDRRYLLQVVRRAAGLSSSLDDREEGFSYRLALLGLLGGAGFLWWFYHRNGMSGPIAAIFIFLHFAMIMAIVRMRAQIGPPAHWMYGTMPEFVLTQFPGTRSVGMRGLAMIALMRSFMTEQEANPAPVQLEGLRIAERGAVQSKHLAWAMMLSIPLIMLSFFWATIHIGYHRGLGSGAPSDLVSISSSAMAKLETWIHDPTGPNWSSTASIGIGAFISLVLMALKLRLTSFPLHPMAFPLAFSWAIDAMLPAITITWIIKSLLLRYGGLRAHQKALPFFLGLIVGEASIGLLGILLSYSLLGR